MKRPRTVPPLFWFRCARCNYLWFGYNHQTNTPGRGLETRETTGDRL